MQYSTNFNMNKPELNEQYRLSHWNDNTDIIDTELKRNADDISSETSRANNAENALRNISDLNFKNALLNFCYPVGSLYWSSKSTDPSTLFGGTWTQIKDRFIWAKGDSDTVNTTGGAKTVTLTESNLPKHSHSFTPRGSITNSLSNDGWFDRGNPSNSGGNEVDGTIFVKDTSFTKRFEFEGSDENFNPRVYARLSHSHTFNGSSGTTGQSGSNTAHENMPPYIVKYCWERTA